MPLTVECPNGHRVRVRNELAGKRIRCPRCKQPARVPRRANLADRLLDRYASKKSVRAMHKRHNNQVDLVARLERGEVTCQLCEAAATRQCASCGICFCRRHIKERDYDEYTSLVCERCGTEHLEYGLFAIAFILLAIVIAAICTWVAAYLSSLAFLSEGGGARVVAPTKRESRPGFHQVHRELAIVREQSKQKSWECVTT